MTTTATSHTTPQLTGEQRAGIQTGLALAELGQHMTDHKLPNPLGIHADYSGIEVHLMEDGLLRWLATLTVDTETVGRHGDSEFSAYRAACRTPFGHRITVLVLFDGDAFHLAENTGPGLTATNTEAVPSC